MMQITTGAVAVNDKLIASHRAFKSEVYGFYYFIVSFDVDYNLM